MTDDFTDLVDLAVEDLGGAAILCNDEFFAEKENLLRAREAEWREHAYTDRGKWMDGWETRRRREAGYDWCIVRLGLPGTIHGIVVDTKWFRGNFPAECSVDACTLPGPLDLAELVPAVWTEILPRTPLRGDSKNPFGIQNRQRFTHVRLNIFPDGGVARLRIHGEALPDWRRLTSSGGLVDLAALEHGAHVMACSDMFFGSRANLIKPGRPVNMSDGWETRRRRGPGHDWSIIRLGATGTIRRVEIDTTHFKGNAPGRATLEGIHAPGTALDALQASTWRPLLETSLQPHTRHMFDGELRVIGPITHARLSVFPDGGVARLRLHGDPVIADPSAAGLARLNGLSASEAVAAMHACCGSARFAELMCALRPFEDLGALIRSADRIWWSLGEADWLEAFAAHPKIGASSSSKWSTDEQSGVRRAGAPMMDALATANQAYADKFGFIYIVCAQGRSADDLLALCERRLSSSRALELRTAAEEQAKITHLRLQKWTT